MKAYLDIMRNILENGHPKQPVRFDTNGVPIPVANGTIGTFAEIFRHDMSQGFPLLTTKRVSLKNIAIELEGFIKGITNKKWYQDKGCHIWDEWANPQTVKEEMKTAKWDCYFHGGPPAASETEEKINKELRQQVQTQCEDLGPVYGYQWRRFAEPYINTDFRHFFLNYAAIRSHYVNSDQLSTIVKRLKENPYDRRMVCSAWNPNQIDEMALPPCHLLWNVVVYENRINLVWVQRSCDLFLGIPYNIASYGLLLLLLAKESNLQLGELVGTLHDCHLYENQIEQAKLQLTRIPRQLPIVRIPDETWQGIFNWTHDQIIVENYNPYPAIKAEVTVQ